MTPHMRAALEAMTRLKATDVAGATTAIRRALSGAPPAARPHAASEPAAATFKVDLPRRLGDVLQALKAGRTRFADAPAGPDCELERGKGSERFTSRSFRNAAGALAYKLYVPQDHAGRRLALVVMLHGCTQDPDDFARGTRMNALADEFGLIVAYPHQPRGANAQGCWNWFDPRHQGRGAGEPGVLAGLALELAATFGIDRDRVFAAGLSAGGAMADVLSITHPDVFRAVGIHSGLPHGAAIDVMSAFAAMKGTVRSPAPAKGAGSRTIIFHGSADATVHPSNGFAVFERLRSAASGVQEMTTDSVVNGRSVTRTRLLPVTGSVIAEHWEIQGGGHAWSSGDALGSFTDATGPDASREMIRFFLEC